jgi:hypothetical protein
MLPDLILSTEQFIIANATGNLTLILPEDSSYVAFFQEWLAKSDEEHGWYNRKQQRVSELHVYYVNPKTSTWEGLLLYHAYVTDMSFYPFSHEGDVEVKIDIQYDYLEFDYNTSAIKAFVRKQRLKNVIKNL